MEHYVKQRLLTLLRVLVFFAGVALVIGGQKQIGYAGLAAMLGGLACMLLVLHSYNVRNR